MKEVVKTIASYASFLPFILGLLLFQRAEKSIRYLTVLLGIACITELTSKALAIRGISNLFLFHIYPVAELFLFTLIYRPHFRTARARNTLSGTAIGFLIFTLVNTVFFQPLHEFNTYGRSLESLLLSVVSITYLMTEINSMESVTKREQPMFWINTAVLMYFPLNLVFFFMSNFLWTHFSREFNNFLWDIHALLSLVQYLIFTIAIYTNWKSRKSPVLS